MTVGPLLVRCLRGLRRGTLSRLLIVVPLMTTACAPRAQPLRLMAAASLRGVVEELAVRYEAQHPGTTVRVETGGSLVLARRVRELAIDVDVLFLADATLFGELLEPDWTSFHLRYATDRMVLGYTDESVGAATIDQESWPDVLGRHDVTLAMADPALAPAGYRTLATLRLYDLLWPGRDLENHVVEKVGARHLRANVAQLLAPLQAGSVDYAFLYAATARAAGLRVVELPAQMNLGELRLSATYARVAIDLGNGRSPRPGGAVVYGVSIPDDAPARPQSIEFLRLALGEEGREILTASGLTPVTGEDRPVAFGLPEDVAEVLASTR